MRIRTILTAAAVPAIIAGSLLGTSLAASASTGPSVNSGYGQASYRATAHESNVADTTNVPTFVTDPTYGPVWAHDDLQRKLTATQLGPNTWWVQIASQGSFTALANPLDGQPWTGTGSVKGNVNYLVTSDHAPVGTNLDSQLPDTMRSGQIVAKWFGVDPANVGAVDYSFSYSPVPVPNDVSPLVTAPGSGISYGQGPNGLGYTQVG